MVRVLPEVQSAVTKMGIVELRPMQEKVIPIVQAGKSVLFESPTASGKTLAFGIPLVELVEKGKGVQALVIAPTRELAFQVAGVLSELAAGKNLSVVTIMGGVDYVLQESVRFADIVVGTPGRLIELIMKKWLMTSKVKLLVVDEVDKLWQAGFLPTMTKLLSNLPKVFQLVACSASLSDMVVEKVSKWQKVLLIRTGGKPSLVHEFVRCASEEKLSFLISLLRDAPRVMIFCATKKRVDTVVKNLARYFVTDVLHAGYPQSERMLCIERFCDDGKILVASDVAARGLDLPGVGLVINYDCPRSVEDYLHRVGRTGRKGEGKVLSLIAAEDERDFRKIVLSEQFKLNEIKLPSFDEVNTVKLSQEEKDRYKTREKRFYGKKKFFGKGKKRKFGR
ncbi:MAG: DEAD/DEAH box helicase [Nanoarchaeota archaeon]|nr:DEAD/DEAH box helicase [Nanoarchaeota archaeon]